MSKNSEALESLVAYCKAHPELRFWQALGAWSGHHYVIVSGVLPCDAGFKDVWEDTFYWEGLQGLRGPSH